jgi:initiation factor 1A
MVNKKGGKGYKKGKGGNDNVRDFPEPGEGTLFARVLKILGNCRIIAYCNDNERRICHIRGAMRKRVWINAGDIILVSTREFESAGGAGTDIDPLDKKFENADVLAKYDTAHHSRLKKEPGFNVQLLVELEKIDFDANGVGHKIQTLLASAKEGDTLKIDYETGEAKVEEVGYEWDRGDSDEEGEDKEDDEDATKPDYKKRHKIQDAKRAEARANKEVVEINIDEI